MDIAMLSKYVEQQAIHKNNPISEEYKTLISFIDEEIKAKRRESDQYQTTSWGKVIEWLKLQGK